MTLLILVIIRYDERIKEKKCKIRHYSTSYDTYTTHMIYLDSLFFVCTLIRES